MSNSRIIADTKLHPEQLSEWLLSAFSPEEMGVLISGVVNFSKVVKKQNDQGDHTIGMQTVIQVLGKLVLSLPSDLQPPILESLKKFGIVLDFMTDKEMEEYLKRGSDDILKQVLQKAKH